MQQVYYHAGVGNRGGVDPENPRRSDRHGLKQIIREAYEHVVWRYESGDELYFWVCNQSLPCLCPVTREIV
jgi:uncharacterized protein (DUF2235 family)